MKKEEGVVIEVIEDTAKIIVGRHSECKSCGACPGNDSAIITSKNKIGAKPGQRVLFEMHEANPIKGAFIIFILPLAGILAGALAGGYIAALMGYSGTGSRILGGFIAFILIAVFIKLLDGHVGQKEKSIPKIIKII